MWLFVPQISLIAASTFMIALPLSPSILLNTPSNICSKCVPSLFSILPIVYFSVLYFTKDMCSNLTFVSRLVSLQKWFFWYHPVVLGSFIALWGNIISFACLRSWFVTWDGHSACISLLLASQYERGFSLNLKDLSFNLHLGLNAKHFNNVSILFHLLSGHCCTVQLDYMPWIQNETGLIRSEPFYLLNSCPLQKPARKFLSAHLLKQVFLLYKLSHVAYKSISV